MCYLFVFRPDHMTFSIYYIRKTLLQKPPIAVHRICFYCITVYATRICCIPVYHIRVNRIRICYICVYRIRVYRINFYRIHTYLFTFIHFIRAYHIFVSHIRFVTACLVRVGHKSECSWREKDSSSGLNAEKWEWDLDVNKNKQNLFLMLTNTTVRQIRQLQDGRNGDSGLRRNAVSVLIVRDGDSTDVIL